MEDPSALEALILSKISTDNPETDSNKYLSGESDSYGRKPLPAIVPSGEEIMKLTSTQCLKQLKQHKVPFKEADFETPLVETPVLLTGPIYGVRIAAMHPDKAPSHSVMDCRLVLALVQTAHQVKAYGINAIEFYSTYRPLSKPPDKCPQGAAGKKCQKKQQRYEQIRSAQTSQHRFARAVDIRLFRTESGDVLDVLNDFDRKSGTDPCSYVPTAQKARILSDIVCTLHARRIFNVMLTPNANKAHHNHFHFDLSPNARWYIVR